MPRRRCLAMSFASQSAEYEQQPRHDYEQWPEAAKVHAAENVEVVEWEHGAHEDQQDTPDEAAA